MRIWGLSTLLLLTTSVQAGTLTLYGQLQAHYGDERAKTDGAIQQRQALGSEGSFIGLKGFRPLNHQLDITFMNETLLQLQTHDNNFRSLTHQRQHWLGLRSPYGEVRTGKQFMPSKVLSHEFDNFKDQFGSVNALIQPDTTVSDSLLYIQQLGKTEVALGWGRDKDTTLSERSVRGGLLNYKTKQGWVMGAGIEVKPNTYTDGRLSLSFKNNKSEIGLLYQHLDAKSNQVLGQDAKSLVFNASQTRGKWTVKAQTGRKEDKTASATKLGALGVDYAANAKLKFYAEHSVISDKDGGVQLGAGARLQGKSAQATSFGMVYKF